MLSRNARRETRGWLIRSRDTGRIGDEAMRVAASHDPQAVERDSTAVALKPCRVLYVVDTLGMGGAEQSLLTTVTRLDRGQFEPIVSSVYVGQTLKAEYEAAGVRVEAMGIKGKYRFATAIRRLVRLIRQEQPDLIHTVLFRAGQIGRIAGLLCRRPVVSTWSSVPYSRERIENDPAVTPWKLRILRKVDSLTCRFVTRFHSVSDCVRDVNCRHLGVSPTKVTVIPRGRDGDHYEKASSIESARLRQALGLEKADPVILNVGRLMSAKNQVALIEAASLLRKSYPNAVLLIAGQGPLRDSLETSVNEQGLERSVRLLGHRADVPLLLGLADVFAFPSLHEGQPGALLEAMLAGLPIVASDIPMHRELIEHGKTGLLVPANDPGAIADGILTLAGDPATTRKLGETAQTIARQRFDIHNVVRETEEFYRMVVGER